MKRKFYAIRFLGGNRTCTTGDPHPLTGRMSIACENKVFRTSEDRNKWIYKENLYAPCGCGGGERIKCTKKYLRSKNLGMSVEDFNEDLEYSEMSHYNCY
jgi:hypothetical protein